MIRTRGSKVNTAKWYNSGSAIVNRTVPTLYHDFVGQRYYDTALGETAFPYTSVHRSSNAMQFDVNGNLVWGPANMYNRSNDMADASWNKNACTLTETGAEVSPTGDKVYKHVVNTATSTIGNDAVGGTWQVITSFPGNAIVAFSFYAKAGEMTTCRIREQITTGTRYIIDLVTGVATHEFGSTLGMSVSTQSAGNGWWRITWKYAVASAATTTNFAIKGGFDTGDGASGFYLSSCQHEMWGPDSPKKYLSSGASASGIYNARFDYDAFTHEPLGILIEQSRSNDIVRTFLLDGTIGTFQDGTGSNGPTYLGGWSSARYTGNGVSNPHFYFGGSVTPGASTSRSVSAIVGYVDTQYLQLTTSSNWALDAANTYMNIDAIAGTITASGSAITDTFIKKLANNVYHIGFTCVSSAAPTGGAGAIVAAINTSTAGRLPSYSHTSSFDVIYLFNGAGVGWNSVTPTFGTAATRAADVATMPIGSWFNQAEGVIYMETVPTSSAGTAKRAICINDGTANNAMSLIRSGSSFVQIRTAVGGVSSFSPTTVNPVVDFQNTKFAALFNSPTKKIVLNGGTVASASAAFPTSGYTTLNTGSEPSSTGYWGGWIKQIRYYNTASPSDAQLQTLTT